MTRQKKTLDKNRGNNRYIITAEIIRKGTEGELYVRRSAADYRIHREQSLVTSSELQKHISTDIFQRQMTTMEIGYLEINQGWNDKEVIVYAVLDDQRPA